jgi:predicted AAA+ superfamily ATPase
MVDQELLRWRDSKRRKPLIVRGARQVGKTYAVVKLGQDHFRQVVRVDLERNRDWHRVFEGNLAARRIVSDLEVLTNGRIVPGETLLFLDEIQSCPRAIMALRYFYEELPDLHVVAAGSLFEFALAEASFPVGRVQFLEMHPMTFAEYLWAIGKDKAAEVVLGEPSATPDAVHVMLLDELRRYCFVGGMPEAVAAYANTQSLQEAFAVHAELCDTFREDCSKYARRADPDCLNATLSGVALGVGRQVKYSRLAEGYAHTTVKRALDLLCKARVVRRVPSAVPSGLPLGATESAARFKAIMVDVGLWQHLCGMKVEAEYAKDDLLAVYRGAMAEQFVGQELMVAQHAGLCYWSREARGSSAEVDYLAVVDGAIYGVEVKSGPAGRLRSLHALLKEHSNCKGGLVFSSAPYAELPDQRLAFLPLYFAFSATRGRGGA